MKIVIVYDGFPWPPRSGDNKRIAQLIDQLRVLGHQVHLLTTALPVGTKQTFNCDRVVYYQPRTMRNALRIIKRKIDAVLEPLGLPTVERTMLRVMGKPTAGGIMDYWQRCPVGLDKYLSRYADQHQIDAVFIEYVWMAPAAALLRPSVLRLMDVHDLQYIRVDEFRKVGKIFPLEIDREREISMYDEFDLVLAIQDKEARHLREFCRRARVVRCGVASFNPVPQRNEPAYDVLFVGGSNEANVHGMRRFISEVWPKVSSRVEGAKLLVAGNVCLGLSDLRNEPGIELLGFVEDTYALYSRAAVVINPVWIGTGLKVKTIEALGYALPLVTTSKGVEGMEPSPLSFHACIINETTMEMATSIIELLTNENIRIGLCKNAIHYAREVLSAEAVYGELEKVLLEYVPSRADAA